MKTLRVLFVASCIWAGLSVALGAFGAHALKQYLNTNFDTQTATRLLNNWETGAKYQMVHALAAIASCLLSLAVVPKASSTHAIQSKENPPASGTQTAKWATTSCLSFLIGSLVFSGCLYTMVLGGPKFLGAIVPIGGAVMIFGWAALAWSGYRLIR